MAGYKRDRVWFWWRKGSEGKKAVERVGRRKGDEDEGGGKEEGGRGGRERPVRVVAPNRDLMCGGDDGMGSEGKKAGEGWEGGKRRKRGPDRVVAPIL